MEQIYKNKLNLLGYTQLVCDIFPKWEDVKDEILVPERKSGTGNKKNLLHITELLITAKIRLLEQLKSSIISLPAMC